MQPSIANSPGFLARVRLTLDMIKFEHSVFALPFALTAALLAWRESGSRTEGLPARLFWIVLAMVGARSAAMAFNRILDTGIDARNPRTQSRHLPAGHLSLGFAWGFTAASAGLLIFAAAMLNPLCLWLSPVALGVVFFYSATKRFTSLAHLVLGFSLGIAPAAAWIAMTGALDPRILWLTAAVTLWTAGFDVIYSCQDYEFDCREGLFSIPARIGIARGLLVSRALHLGMMACLAALATAFGAGWPGWTAVVLVGLLLAYEHSLVRADDLSRVNAAFFTVNGWVGVLFFMLWALQVFLYDTRATN
jgi:4-hydroxybenzoate polyprenyltransferase